MARQILLAEDDRATREGYLELLSACGYDVLAVADGEEALRAVRQHAPDALVTDLNMPLLDGLALASEIREEPGPVRSIPILALTGDVTPARSRQALALGITLILKPCSPAHLQAELTRLLGGRAS
jgi:CheY-like chemotaxis protein